MVKTFNILTLKHCTVLCTIYAANNSETTWHSGLCWVADRIDLHEYGKFFQKRQVETSKGPYQVSDKKSFDYKFRNHPPFHETSVFASLYFNSKSQKKHPLKLMDYDREKKKGKNSLGNGPVRLRAGSCDRTKRLRLRRRPCKGFRQ